MKLKRIAAMPFALVAIVKSIAGSPRPTDKQWAEIQSLCAALLDVVGKTDEVNQNKNI